MDREYPAVSNLRCQACTIMGGTVATKETARAIAAFPELEGERVRIGRRVRLEPCLPAHMLAVIQAREGRKCPRVELMDENAEPAQLCAILGREETRGLAGRWIKQNVDPLGEDESRTVLNRAIAAWLSEKVGELMEPRPAQSGEAPE